jgi:capsid protein
MQAQIRAGLITWSEQVRSLGYEPDQVLKEYAEDQANADKAGVMFDSDPRKSLTAPAPAPADPAANDATDGAAGGDNGNNPPPDGGDQGQQ